MATTKDNKYQVKIIFDKRRKECNIGAQNVKYHLGGERYDIFEFKSNELLIDCSRNKKYEDGRILSNNQNSLNLQILKGLIYYYIISNDIPKINSIEIKLIRQKLGDFIYTDKLDMQPISFKYEKELIFNKEKINIIFKENEKANAIRIALTYWLKGISSDDRYYKFERLWRAYNRLFMFHGGSNKEFDCMKDMRQLIIDNHELFNKSTIITNSFNSNKLRSFRWRKLILNDYPKINNVGAFKEFICRHSDKRIMLLIKDMLPYRKDHLLTKGYLSTVESHLSNNINTSNDIELVTLLSLKYAYYVRNKMFHGEISDRTFTVHETDEDIEIDNINTLLSTLIFELIENNHIL